MRSVAIPIRDVSYILQLGNLWVLRHVQTCRPFLMVGSDFRRAIEIGLWFSLSRANTVCVVRPESSSLVGVISKDQSNRSHKPNRGQFDPPLVPRVLGVQAIINHLKYSKSLDQL